MATLLAALAPWLLLLLAGLLLPAAALLATLSRLLTALMLTTLAALTALLTALILIFIRHFHLTPTREDSRAGQRTSWLQRSLFATQA